MNICQKSNVFVKHQITNLFKVFIVFQMKFGKQIILLTNQKNPKNKRLNINIKLHKELNFILRNNYILPAETNDFERLSK